MGTWKAPVTKLEKTELKKKFKELKKLQNEISEIFGDDIVLDHFDIANDRIEYGIKGRWAKSDHRTSDCLHPAYIGDAPGVCKLRRLNVSEESA